jgi:hypothetical protein
MVTPLVHNIKSTKTYIPRSTLIGHKRKRINLHITKNTDLAPILYGRLRTGLEHPNPRTIKILLDSGASASIIQYNCVEKLRLKQQRDPLKWKTAAGELSTNYQVDIEFSLPELHESRMVQWTVHVAKTCGNYDLILGRDIMRELGLTFSFLTCTTTWDENTIPMKESNCSVTNSYFIHDSPAVEDSTDRVKRILDAKYEKADLTALVKDMTYLSKEEQASLLNLLLQHENLFNGTLGHWYDSAYNIELREGVEPYHAKPYPVPRIHEATLKAEVERLCTVGVLKRVNRSEWGAPTFIIPKKDGSVRFITDFRELNKRIKRKPYPIPKIQDLMLKLEGFQYATSLDLNMGYYHIELTPFSKQLCTIILPFGKYEYQRLPMGLCNSPDIFQEKISELMLGLEFVRAYIDDILVLTHSDWKDHIAKLTLVFERIQSAGLKVNAVKSFFGKNAVEYLGYWITRKGIQPLPKKVEALKNLLPPTNKRELRRFIGLINYYRDMWTKRSHILAPLASLTSKLAKWHWGNVEQTAFDNIKKIVAKEVLLSYPDFTKPFQMYTDASHLQLGAIITQSGKPIAYWSRKLNPAQTRYTTTERELLSIVEALKEFRNVLLGHRIQVFTDHQNLTYKQFNTDRVMRWRLLIEEFGPELIYIKGEHNIAADALSRLPFLTPSIDLQLFEYFNFDDAELPADAFPVTYATIAAEQRKDAPLINLLTSQPGYTLHTFRGGGKYWELVIAKEKIIIPQALQKRVVDWYHLHLCHPGTTRTEATIRQHFYWKNLRKDVEQTCRRCKICQKSKASTSKYGKLPLKEAESEPWERLHVDLIGPYKLNKQKGVKPLRAVTMIDPATGWFEVREIDTKHAYNVAEAVELAWLTRYPRPNIITYDKGTEFLAEFAKMVKNDYGLICKPITTRNPQSNAVLERIHKTIADIIRTHQLNDIELDVQDPWSGVLAAAMWATRATIHTTLQATPMQLVFGRDAVLNIKFQANWKYIKERKEKLILKNNERENKKRIAYDYAPGQKVLLKARYEGKYAGNMFDGPYVISHVNSNGTVRLNRGSFLETVNIRNIKPFHEE